MKGDKIVDMSMDPDSSPPYEDFTSWILPSQEGAYGTLWKDGFLVCGGTTNNATEENTAKCSHMTIGDTVATEYPDMESNFSRAAATTVNGQMWVTGGLMQGNGVLHQLFRQKTTGPDAI